MLITDKTLVKQFQKGNTSSFSSIYKRYIDKIYTYIYYKTMHKETAEDITSQTFLNAFEHLNSFNTKQGSVQSWLYKIAYNLIIDYYRKMKDTDTINDIWDCSDNSNIEIDFINKESFNFAFDLLQKLPEQKRDIVIMRIWQDLSYREIADITGISEANCKMTFYRTIDLLRKELLLSLLIMYASGLNKFFN